MPVARKFHPPLSLVYYLLNYQHSYNLRLKLRVKLASELWVVLLIHYLCTEIRLELYDRHMEDGEVSEGLK